MHRRLIAAITFALLGAGMAAHAQKHDAKQDQYRYKWVDAQGLPHYSDSLTEDAIRRGYDVVNNQGLVVRHVNRPMTAAERKAANARAQASARAQAERQRQQREDQQMLAAYPTEADFATAQQAELDNLDQSIKTTRMNLHSQESSLSELLAHAASIQGSGGKVSVSLNQRIALQRKAVSEQRDTLDRLIKERASAETEAKARLHRYRELRAQEQRQLEGAGS
jgi:hypothetical protein